MSKISYMPDGRVRIEEPDGQVLYGRVIPVGGDPEDYKPMVYRRCKNLDCGALGNDLLCQFCKSETEEVDAFYCICGEVHPADEMIEHLTTSPNHDEGGDELYEQYGVWSK